MRNKSGVVPLIAALAFICLPFAVRAADEGGDPQANEEDQQIVIVSVSPDIGAISLLDIGDALDNSDFIITTDPAGYGDMAFIVAGATLAIGENNVTFELIDDNDDVSEASTTFTAATFDATFTDFTWDQTEDYFWFDATIDGCDGTYTLNMTDLGDGELSDDVPYDADGETQLTFAPTDDAPRLAYGLGSIPRKAKSYVHMAEGKVGWAVITRRFTKVTMNPVSVTTLYTAVVR